MTRATFLSRYQRAIVPGAIVVGIFLTLQFHGDIFSGGSTVWPYSLARTSGVFFVFALIGAAIYSGGSIKLLSILAAPFVAIDVMLFLGSAASGGDPRSFLAEIFAIFGAVAVGGILGRLLRGIVRSPTP